MPRHALVETTLAEDAEGGGQPALHVLALLQFVFENGWPREVDGAVLGVFAVDAGFEGGFAVVDGIAVGVGCVRCHCG